MYKMPDEVFVEEWRSNYTNAECAVRLRIKPSQLEYAWKQLRLRGLIPPYPRSMGGRPPKIEETSSQWPQWPESEYRPEEFDGRPRVPKRDLLLERLRERGHDYAEGS